MFNVHENFNETNLSLLLCINYRAWRQYLNNFSTVIVQILTPCPVLNTVQKLQAMFSFIENYNFPYKGSENGGKVGTVHNFITRKEEKMASAKLFISSHLASTLASVTSRYGLNLLELLLNSWSRCTKEQPIHERILTRKILHFFFKS